MGFTNVTVGVLLCIVAPHCVLDIARPQCELSRHQTLLHVGILFPKMCWSAISTRFQGGIGAELLAVTASILCKTPDSSILNP